MAFLNNGAGRFSKNISLPGKNKNQMGNVIQIESAKAELSKEQIKFNKKIQAIEKLKNDLETMKRRMQRGQQLAMQHIAPLEQEHISLKREYVRILDASYDSKFFKKKEKEKIEYLIMDEMTLFHLHGLMDDEMKAIENKFMDDDDLSLATDLFNDIFGFNLEADDLKDMERMKAKFAAQQEEAEAQQNAFKAKKSKKQQEKEAEQKQETLNITKAVKKIYTDLVKLLHPDRELDVKKKAEKTEWMKEVTGAYQENNFFALLHLHQRFLAETNPQMLLEMADDQLKYYTKLLNEQQTDLKNEMASLKRHPLAKAALDLTSGCSEKQERRLQEMIQEREIDIETQRDLNEQSLDPAQLRLYIKHINLEFLRSRDLNDLPFAF